ncbi:MAG: phosphonate ABC transporter substrate-binding protein, partial [Cyanobacteria bacterium J06649_11]
MKRRSLMQRAGLFALAITGSIVFAACSSSSDSASDTQKPLEVSEIKFGIISTESQSNQKPIWDPFIKEMEKQIGVPVKPFYV